MFLHGIDDVRKVGRFLFSWSFWRWIRRSNAHCRCGHFVHKVKFLFFLCAAMCWGKYKLILSLHKHLSRSYVSFSGVSSISASLLLVAGDGNRRPGHFHCSSSITPDSSCLYMASSTSGGGSSSSSSLAMHGMDHSSFIGSASVNAQPCGVYVWNIYITVSVLIIILEILFCCGNVNKSENQNVKCGPLWEILWTNFWMRSILLS